VPTTCTPPASREVQQPLVPQDVQCPYDCVLVDAKHRRQVDRRRQAFTLDGLTLGDGTSYLGRHLFVEGDWIALVDLGSSHGTVCHSTIFTVITEEP
jgi:hypothetical protein